MKFTYCFKLLYKFLSLISQFRKDQYIEKVKKEAYLQKEVDAQEIKSLYDQLREQNREFLKNPKKIEVSSHSENTNNKIDPTLLVELEKLLNEKEEKLQQLLNEVQNERRAKNQFKAQSEEV
jgi:superfamily II DNA/RNA helicase